jgi:hypothetical protein
MAPPAYGKGEVPSGSGAFPFAGKVPPKDEKCVCKAMGGEPMEEPAPVKKAPRRASRAKKGKAKGGKKTKKAKPAKRNARKRKK